MFVAHGEEGGGSLSPDMLIELPEFTADLCIRPVLCQLDAVILHRGSAPNHGHYQVLLCNVDGSQAFLADDNGPAQRISTRGVADCFGDTYMFVYRRC